MTQLGEEVVRLDIDIGIKAEKFGLKLIVTGEPLLDYETKNLVLANRILMGEGIYWKQEVLKTYWANLLKT